VLVLQTGVVVEAPKFVMQSEAAIHTKHLPDFEPVVAQLRLPLAKLGQFALAVHAQTPSVHV